MADLACRIGQHPGISSKLLSL